MPMDYLMEVLNDLQALETGGTGLHDDASGRLTLQDSRVLRVILNEVENTALLIAVSTCVVNALAGGSVAGLSEEALATYLPPEPRIFPAMSAQLSTLDLPVATVRDLQEFYARLDLARKMTQMFSKYPAALDNKGGVHIDILTDTWQDLCRHALSLAKALQHWTRRGNELHATAQWSAAVRILTAAGAGEWPCVSAAGNIEVPCWAEQRRYERWKVEWSALLHARGLSHEVDVVDVSRGGFGIDSNSEHEVGEKVALELASGHRFDGNIAWVGGRKLGMTLLQPMSRNDPIIAAAQEVVEPVQSS